MIRDVLAIETGDLVFPIIFEVATSREYHAARELYGARFKHISLAISDIDTKFYLISTICRYIFIIIRIPETSPHDVNPRHSRFSVLQLKFSKGRQKIWYILVINLQSYFGELWHIIPIFIARYQTPSAVFRMTCRIASGQSHQALADALPPNA